MKARRNTQQYLLILLCIAVVAFFAFRTPVYPGRISTATPALDLHDPFLHTYEGGKRPADTLVIYIFSNTDSEYERNLRFFLAYAVAENDGCDYTVVIQTGETIKKIDPLPEVPPNVRFEFHPNSCYDWGTIGWLFDNHKVDTSQYKYFIFINSSVRGPFLPPYLAGKVRWQDILISRLNDNVKLIGPTISCEGSPKEGNVNGEWRTNPHVQSYVLATDQIGLQTMLADGRVFQCHKDMWDTIFYAELGSSLSVLNAGYTLDSFMTRYQGVDWTDKNNWDCNSRVNPYGENYYDGITLSPYEVLFVKVKGVLLQNDWSYARFAKKYDEWITQQRTGTQEVASNVWKTNPWPIKLPKLAYMKSRGPLCFDHEYYRTKNNDLSTITEPRQLWDHWLTLGEFEGRPFRFTCDMPLQ
ncbi:hypothetical protein WJX72_002733 [[Myrmecia] bisecta]|uniref:Uncharacterized protein n=1 Tax=[Myrmecia] bisecta TaxID=41462 RepID=A0AAW1PKX7_9CHLO